MWQQRILTWHKKTVYYSVDFYILGIVDESEGCAVPWTKQLALAP